MPTATVALTSHSSVWTNRRSEHPRMVVPNKLLHATAQSAAREQWRWALEE
jgi:hypothetical protein